MNDSLRNLLKYLVYGVIIYLLIVVVPEKKTQTTETIMITFIAVGSYMILDTFCASISKTLEGMDDDLGLDDLDDLDLEGDDTEKEPKSSDDKEVVKDDKKEDADEKEDANKKDDDEADLSDQPEDNNDEESDLEEQQGDDLSMMDQDLAEIDSEDMPEKECNTVETCRTKMKEVHNMYKKQITDIKKDHADKISELEYAKKDLDKLSDSNIKPNKQETKVLFKKSVTKSDDGKLKDGNTVNSVYKKTLGKASTDEDFYEFKRITKYVMKSMNMDKVPFEKLNEQDKKVVLEKAHKLLLRKQVMTELGIKNTSYKNLPKSVKRKVDVMTLLALDEAKGIAKESSDDLKMYMDDTSDKQSRISKLRKMRMGKDSDDEDWNESRYTEFPDEMNKPLGSYDDTMTNKWNHGYTYLSTDKWSVPMVRPPVCINSSPCNVCPSNTSGYPVNLMDFDNSRKITKPKLNKKYIKENL